MKIKMLLTTLMLLTTISSASCDVKYQTINGKKMMSNCAWVEYLGKTPSNVDYNTSTNYDFSRTYMAESNNRFDAVNRNDVGNGMSLGIVQFNGKYSKILAKKLGIEPWMSTKEIKRRLRTPYSRKLQLSMFKDKFVDPILKFAANKNITDKKVIEFIVDWRVNGMPKKYYKLITSSTSIYELVSMRNNRYYRLHKSKPRKYTKQILKHWLWRSNSFLA